MAAPFQWQSAAPESQGLDADALQAVVAGLAADTKALFVVRNDHVVLEWYGQDHAADKPHYTASLAKALVGGMSLLLALEEGRLRVDDPAWLYVPAWRDDPLKSRITVRHLATHSSGIEDAETTGQTHFDQGGWKQAFWDRDAPDPFTVARDRAPVVFEPGSAFAYSNPGMAMLSWVITASLQQAETMGAPGGTGDDDVRALLQRRILEPIGVPASEWNIGYGETHRVDGLGLVPNWGGGSCTARAAARVGRLLLRRGDWEGRRLFDPAWLDRVVAWAGTPADESGPHRPLSGLGFWTNADGRWPALPRDAFGGAGAGNQHLLVVPSLDLIVVRQGAALGDGSFKGDFWTAVHERLFAPIAAALPPPPVPRSDVIAGAWFEPPSRVERRARGRWGNRWDGGDNWPMTWVRDDLQLTAYGDGFGVEPGLDAKLGMGFVHLRGQPPGFDAVNVRSPTGENAGYGANGIKASGLLAIDDTAYLVARNAGASVLAWSTDEGRTWEWSDWRWETTLGYATFVNFGPGYGGARDGFVYLLSKDGDDAYVPTDRLILARAPRGRLREADAWEYFAGTPDTPRWSADLVARTAVFEHPDHAYRIGVTYNAGLGRYLLVAILPGEPRFAGGFGVYEAPEPWGPWRTVYFTEKWDVGPGDASSLPTMWMSLDGQTCHIAFAGDDCLSVRRVRFSVVPEVLR